MARRGRFGRLPSAAPSLTNTIVSIAREMQNQRDQNLMDAWKNGGTFEGQPATDDAVLNHWKERLAGISTKDPLYDTYKNTVFQYEYAIAESKVSTAYAQGKMSDGQVAKFYLDWSKKVPKDSEFYRTLIRDSAQFMRSAASKGAARASATKETTFTSSQDAIAAKYERTGQYLTDVLTNIARANGLIDTNQNHDLRYFDTSDPAAMLTLIGSLNGSTTKTINPDTGAVESTRNTGNVLYRDPVTGANVTSGDVQAALAQLDPHFTGSVTYEYFASALKQQQQGQTLRLQNAAATGHGTSNIEDQRTYTSEIGREVGAWPVEQSYNNARDKFLQTGLSDAASPLEKLAAFKQYQQDLLSLANDSKHPPDDSTRARLVAEATGDGSVDSLAESFTGLTSGDHTTLYGSGQSKGDIADTWADINRYAAMAQAVAAGQAIWTMGSTKNGTFVPGQGTEIGATDQQPPSGSINVFVPQKNGAPAIPVVVSPIPVVVKVVDPNGNTVDATTPNSKQVAVAYDTVMNGQVTRIYLYSNNGQQVFTKDLPHGSNVAVSNGAGVITMTVTLSDVPDAKNTAGNPLFTQVLDAYGRPTGQVTVDAAGALLATEPERLGSGPDPASDFTSPTIAALIDTPDGQKTIAELNQNSAYRFQTEYEARTSAGQTYDPATKSWSGGDPALVDRNLQQVYEASIVVNKVNGLTGFVETAASRWDRTTVPASIPASSNFVGGGPKTGGFKTGLPADNARDTQFAPLAQAFVPNSMQFKPNESQSGGVQIKTGSTITVPKAPDITIRPTANTIKPNATQGYQYAPTLAPLTPTPAPPGNSGMGDGGLMDFTKLTPPPPPPPAATPRPRIS